MNITQCITISSKKKCFYASRCVPTEGRISPGQEGKWNRARALSAWLADPRDALRILDLQVDFLYASNTKHQPEQPWKNLVRT
jgi:hypothetical protein